MEPLWEINMKKLLRDIYQAINTNRLRSRGTLAIANGQAISEVLNCGTKSLVGVLMPDALTSATFTIEGSLDGTNFYPITNNYGAGLNAIAFVGDTLFSIDPSLTLPWQYIRLVTVGAEGAARSFSAITRFVS